MPSTPKIVAALLIVVSVVMLPRFAWAPYGLAGSTLLVVALLSRLPAPALVRRMLVLEPFAVAVALLSLFQPDGTRIFLTMIAKSALCIFTMILLVATTRFSDVLASLVRLGVPRILVTTLALMYRYLSLLADEMARIQRARRSRTFLAGRRRDWQSKAGVIAQVFVLTSERAERIYAAMCARGWRS